MCAARLAGAWGVLATLGLATATAATAAAAAPPAVGRHSAQLCVATSAAAPSCGPAQVDLRSDGSLRMRIDDVVYRLQLHRSQVAVTVMHNVVQIDAFTVPYEWVGSTLQFVDGERHARYEIRFPQRTH